MDESGREGNGNGIFATIFTTNEAAVGFLDANFMIGVS